MANFTKYFLSFSAALLIVISLSSLQKEVPQKGWIKLFDGKSLDGWKVGENPETFKVEDGAIVVFGNRAHLFYDGPVNDHAFKNFEYKATVMTKPGANSGMYIHTAFQQEGFPSQGYEIQVNNSHTDWRRTGSVYGIQDVKEPPAKDDKWFTQHIIVQGNKITVKVDGKTINEYTVPAEGGKLSTGTFALQGHDPKSKVFYKDIMVKPLPE
ncbi:MAG: DUF1080 domain-containing protein [Cyclobacteriaceae bacterium]